MLVGKAELRPDETRYRHTNNQSSTSIFGRKGNTYIRQGVGGWDKDRQAAASTVSVGAELALICDLDLMMESSWNFRAL